MKIGLYFGSFDPMHLGHLKVIAQALNRYKLDQIVIAPTIQNPIKPHPPLDIEIRKKIILAELQHASGLLDPSKVTVDLIEKQLSPPYYTYITLQKLSEKYKHHQLSIIMGSDCMATVKYWAHGNHILQNYHLIVVDRTTESSTEIRKRITSQEPLTGLVPSGSESFVTKQYRMAQNRLP